MERQRASWWESVVLATVLGLVLSLLTTCGAAPASTTPATAVTPAAAGSSTQATAPPDGIAPAAPTAAGATTRSLHDSARFLVFGNSGEPDSLDAMDTFSGQALAITEQIEEPLVGRIPGKVGITPLLAERWTSTADLTEWIFTLRKGVSFHDGTPFDADAVVFNFRRMAEPDFASGYRDQGKTYPGFGDIFGGFANTPGTAWKAIEKIDDATVKMTMTRPFPLLPDVLSSSYFGISSPSAITQAGARYGSPDGGAVGTGPFKLDRWTPGQSIVLVRNETYWGEPARMPGVVVRFIADAPARLAELQAGAIDFTTNLPADARAVIDGDPNLTTVPLEPFNVAYIAMNLLDKPLDNPMVRQAIAHAIDKQEILQGFYGGVGVVATSFLPDSLAWARPETLEPYPHDPAKARELLAAAGYPDGFSTMVLMDGREIPLEFWYMPISRPYYPAPQSIAETFAAQLAEVGIKVELKTEDWGAYLDNVSAGTKHGMWMLGWTGDYADPNNFLYVFFGPKAAIQQGYANPQVIDALVRAGSAGSEDATRLFREAGHLIAQDVPRIPIVHAPPVYGAKKTLQGWTPSPFGSEPWKTVFIAK